MAANGELHVVDDGPGLTSTRAPAPSTASGGRATSRDPGLDRRSRSAWSSATAGTSSRGPLPRAASTRWSATGRPRRQGRRRAEVRPGRRRDTAARRATASGPTTIAVRTGHPRRAGPSLKEGMPDRGRTRGSSRSATGASTAARSTSASGRRTRASVRATRRRRRRRTLLDARARRTVRAPRGAEWMVGSTSSAFACRAIIDRPIAGERPVPIEQGLLPPWAEHASAHAEAERPPRPLGGRGRRAPLLARRATQWPPPERAHEGPWPRAARGKSWRRTPT